MGLWPISIVRMLIPSTNLSFNIVFIYVRNLELINQRRLRILVCTVNVLHIKQIVHGRLIFILERVQISYVLPNLNRNTTINVIRKLLTPTANSRQNQTLYYKWASRS